MTISSLHGHNTVFTGVSIEDATTIAEMIRTAASVGGGLPMVRVEMRNNRKIVFINANHVQTIEVDPNR